MEASTMLMICKDCFTSWYGAENGQPTQRSKQVPFFCNLLQVCQTQCIPRLAVVFVPGCMLTFLYTWCMYLAYMVYTWRMHMVHTQYASLVHNKTFENKPLTFSTHYPRVTRWADTRISGDIINACTAIKTWITGTFVNI